MRKSLIGLFIFLTPVFIFLIIPTYIVWHSKENFYEIDKILTSKKKYLIGYAYNETNYHYLKWFDFKSNERKEIWTLGSSRVLPFRKQMFDSSFYNGGFAVSHVKDFRNVLKSIPPNKYPKYLIIGLDQWMFNAAWQGNLNHSGDTWHHDFKFYPSMPETYRMVYNDLFTRKYKRNFIQETRSIQRIGINSIFNNTGFRSDGSMYWGEPSKEINVVNKFLDTYSRIKQGRFFFEYGNDVCEQTLIELNELLKYCQQYQIKVIAFLPPFSDAIYNAMIASKKYSYLTKIYPKVKPLFDKYHYEVYDFSNVSLCNSNDNEVTDGFHGGEITYQRLLIKMLHSGSVLNHLTNVERLSADLSKKKNNYILYDY